MATTSSTSTSNTTSGQIKWTGMTSGIDFKSVVDALVASERRVITRQQTWQSQWQEKLTSINNLDIRLSGLKADVNGYDTRDELLARKATSSKETVATITNTSTAATGVYSVEVGEDIVEKIASKTYKDDLGIGANISKNSDGNLIDQQGRVIGTSTLDDQNVLDALEAETGLTGIYFDGTSQYYDSTSTLVATWDGTSEITINGQLSPFIELVANNDGSSRNELVISSSGKTIATSDATHAHAYHDLVIEMGGKTISFSYDDGALEDGFGDLDPTALASNTTLYSPKMTLEQLADLINRAVGADPAAPNISAEVVFDKKRGSDNYSRLVITGGEGGQTNHINIKDPTDLCLNKNSIDDPVTNSMLGSQFIPEIDASSNYTGHVNKTITVVATNSKDGNILGTNPIEFSWADTEGKKGTFIIRSEDWDHSTNSLKNPIELEQGVVINLKGKGTDSSKNVTIINEAFTIDCQNPVMQKATDVGLAQTDKWVHQGVADLTSPVTYGASGKLVLSYAGTEYSITIPDGLGLKGMVERINADSNNPGIIASVLNDGMGTATSYKLVLTGSKEGAENGIRILEGTKLNRMETGPEAWTHAREAANSMCRIDGYPNDGTSWIQRPSNEVGDVLTGCVINLEGAGTTQIIIQNDVTEMMNRIKLIIESVNYCKSYIKEQTQFTGSKLVSKVLEDGTFVRETTTGKDANGNSSDAASGVMIGNYGFQIAQSTIDRFMTKPIFTREEYIQAIDSQKKKEALYPVTVEDEERDGPSQEGIYKAYLEQNGLVYTKLSDIGIASNPDMKGQYGVYEESKLKEALSKNPEAVIKLFTFTPDDTKIASSSKYTDEDPRPPIGGLAVMMGWAMSDLTRSVDDLDKDGNVVSSAKGITKVLAENYAKIISGIDDKIAREEKRIAMVKQRLEDKFSRLEVLLSSLNDQSTSLQSQLNQLSGNNN